MTLFSWSHGRLRFYPSRQGLKGSLQDIDVKILVVSLAALALLCIYRFYDYWTTGFFVSDEYGYFVDATHGTIYADRWFVGWMNIFLFRALGITGVDSFSYLLPFYLFFWTAITLIVFYKLLKLLDFDKVTIALSMLSTFILISFVLLSLGFLTEPVGLCVAMSGVYFLTRLLKSKSAFGMMTYAFLACCFFGFASGTREPYDAFLIAGGLIVMAIAVSRRRESIRTRRLGTRLVLVVAVLAFLAPAAFFLFVPSHAYSQQVAPISSDLLQSVTTNPLTTAPVSTTTITTDVTVNKTVTINNIVTVSTTVTSTTIVKTSTASVPFYRQFVLTNTLLIFFGGLVLGWGPISFAIGLAGFLILFQKAVRRSESTARFVLFTSLTALGSYLIVSFIYAPDPYYFSLRNYSTVIRFSDTALPAYFMAAPFFLAIVSRTRKRMVGLAAVCVAFLVIAVPTYQVYAASNFNGIVGNPFSLDYRTPAAQVRDYFASSGGGGPYYLAGLPYGWAMTPGVQDLKGLSAYTLVDNGQAPYLNSSRFVSLHWTSFYISSSDTTGQGKDFPDFLSGLFQKNGTATLPYSLVDSQIVLRGPDIDLIHVSISWK